MNLIEYMLTEEYQTLSERYERHFNDPVPTIIFRGYEGEDIKSAIINAIEQDEPLIIAQDGIYY